MSGTFRYPDFSFEWHHYLRRPWRLRWKFRTIPSHLGPEFVDYHILLGRSLHWPVEQINRYQWTKISSLLEHAFRTVPFYQRWARENRVTAADIRGWEDFRQLPIINRSHIDRDLADFTSSEFERFRGAPSQTSGSSGRTLKFFRSWDTESMRRAVQWRHFNHLGYEFKQPRVSLNVPFVGAEADLLYRYDAIDNVVIFNGRFLNEQYTPAICRVIARFKPRMFYAHPTALAVLAKSMEKSAQEPLAIPVVYVYSELISAATLATIQKWIGPQVNDHFGNRENSVSASQLKCGNYHVNSEFVHVELVESDQQFAGQKMGRVVGTNLINYAMPIIRYDCHDLGSSIGSCDRCRIQHPVISFVGGREKNFLVSRHGLLHCQYDDFLHKQNIPMPDDLQVEQVDLDHLILRMVPGERYARDRDEPVLVEQLRSATKGWFQIQVEYVDIIKPTPGFKKSKVVSRLGDQAISGSA